MQKLSEVMTRGKYVVSQVTAEHQLKKRLSEMGMVRGKILTVITQNMHANGVMIHFQGQRLALSDSIASCIEVLSVNELAEQELKPLSQLNLQQSCLVAKIGGKKELKRRLMDMGLTQNTLVTLVNTAPLGDPLEILLRGYKLTLRRSEAELIMVREISI